MRLDRLSSRGFFNLNRRCFDGRGFADRSLAGNGFAAVDAFCNHGGGSSHGNRGDCLGVVTGSFAVLGALDQVAIGITLTFATIAATTLTAGTATRAFAIVAVLLVVLQLLFVRQCFVLQGLGLLGTRLTLFTRLTLTLLTFTTRLALGTLFALLVTSIGIEWFAQFTHALFTRGTFFARLALTAIFLTFARLTWGALFTRLTLFARLAFFTRFTGLTLFTRGALFTRFALVIAATATVTALLTTVAALFARRTLVALLLDYCGLGFFFLAGEQADQRLHQALEQARFRRLGRSQWCLRLGSDRGAAARCGLDRSFLANQSARGGGRLGGGFFGFRSGGDFVAGLAAQGFRAIVTQALHFEMRGFQMIVRQDHDTRTGAQFDLGDRVALLVEQEGGDRDRYLSADFGGAILQRFFFDQAQDGQRQGFDVTDDALAVAAWADDAAGLAEGRTQALTGHFQQAEARDAADLNAGAVGFQGFTHLLFDGALVLGRGHVDEVDDDQAADVAQAQLAGDFFGRFQVGLQRGFLDVAALGGARRVDVDGNQGLGRVDDDGTTGRQLHFTLEGGFDLAFDLEAVEQRHAVFVQLDLAGVLRHHLLDKGQRFFLGFDAVDQHFADVLAQVVADGADDDVGFLIDQERGRAAGGGFLDGAPQLQQVVEVPLHFFAGAAQAGSAHDQAHVGRSVEAIQRFTQFVALFTFDAAADAAGTRVVRHQHQVTTGQADEGGQGCALVAAFFFLDLDDDFLAFLEHVLDVDAAAFRRLGEIFAGDFFEGEEAVAFGAEVDESGFEAGFNAGDAAFVDVGLFLFTGAGLDVQVVEFLAIYQGNTQLFRLSRVN